MDNLRNGKGKEYLCAQMEKRMEKGKNLIY